MNREELIDVISKDSDVSKAAADRMLRSMIDNVQKTVSKGDKITLVGFGTFSSTKRAARTGRNPRTGDPIKIAASVVPKFSAGAAFKAAVNKRKAK